MATKTQTSQLFIIQPGAEPTVTEVGQVTSISGIDAPISSVESTTLASDHRSYTPGIAEPATASFKILFDAGDEVQASLHALRNSGTILHWAVGFSDAQTTPKLATGTDTFDQAAGARSFIYFDGFCTTWDFGFEVNGVVESTVGIQLTNRPELVRASA